ncbi:MAG TPA: hypothetical protein VGF17_10300 [Phytomonospora sp.]
MWAAEVDHGDFAGLLDGFAEEILEGTMSTRTSGYRSTLLRTAYAEARAKARAEAYAEGFAESTGWAVLQVLASRGLPLSEENAERIRECRDQDQLNAWLDRAVFADSAEKIFD